MFEHGVRYGQAVTSTEVQQQDTTRVQIRGAVPPNHAPPGITVVAHMGVEVPQQNYGVPSRSTFQHPSQGLQEGWVLHTAVRPISRNNSETPIPGPKAQGNNPLIYRGKLQHMAAELGGYKQAHPSPTPLTMGYSREEESPTSLKELGSRAQAPDSLSRVWVAGASAHDRYPKHMAPDPYAPSCGWWAYGKVGLCRFFGLCPAESRRQRLGHQALACVPQSQAWLQGGAPVTPVRATHNLQDDVRQDLYKAVDEWVSAIGKNKKFMGGEKPNLADLAVFGVLRVMEGLQAFDEMLENTKVKKWYGRMQNSVHHHRE
ncbi:hypothetical protein QTP86_025702 [Hemibagrus guttatus]|nr:hypothetical protein QTP86_025702 [Hemibagrus guttatus]